MPTAVAVGSIKIAKLWAHNVQLNGKKLDFNNHLRFHFAAYIQYIQLKWPFQLLLSLCFFFCIHFLHMDDVTLDMNIVNFKKLKNLKQQNLIWVHWLKYATGICLHCNDIYADAHILLTISQAACAYIYRQHEKWLRLVERKRISKRNNKVNGNNYIGVGIEIPTPRLDPTWIYILMFHIILAALYRWLFSQHSFIPGTQCPLISAKTRGEKSKNKRTTNIIWYNLHGYLCMVDVNACNGI